MPNGLHLEESHERTRVVLRVDEVRPLESPQSPAMHVEPSPQSAGEPRRPGRKFAKGNLAWRLRQAEQLKQTGIATMNPANAPPWLRPHIELGAPYIAALYALLAGKEALHPLAGDTADAHVMYRACLALAVSAETAKERSAMMAEARGWLREHRTALGTLSALSGGMKLPEPTIDLTAALEAGRR